jgi:hypothetical protein
MPTKRNKAGYQQPYVGKGHGDESGEYRDNGYGGSAPSVNHGRQNAQVTNNYLDYQTKPIEKMGKENPTNEVYELRTNYKKILNKYITYPEGTYDLSTGKEITYKDGYQVSFHQTSDNYSQEEYNKIVDELKTISGSGAHIGVFDEEPEVSFHFNSLEEAKKVMKKYNQHSIFDWKAYATGRPSKEWYIKNDSLDKSKNNVS